METNIYVLTHKDFIGPPDPMYKTLSVHESIKDNIAYKNDTFSELTGLYWIWKNDNKSEIVGTAHYRRYLLNKEGELLKKAEIEDILSDYDCITTKELLLNFSYYHGFGENHKQYYLDELRKVIYEICPNYGEIYDLLVQQNHTYFGNMMIAKKQLYDDYCNWLFTILFAMEKRIVIDEPDSYHRRIFGFISEFLWYVYVKKNKLDVYETMVGMTTEKVETKEIKTKIKSYFKKKDFIGAKRYFLEERKKRPDILMEASDITGELHMCMEVISICEYEEDAQKINLLERISDFDQLMTYCRKLNKYVQDSMNTENANDIDEWLKNVGITDEALYVAKAMHSTINRINLT